jgi:hypothetical protein
VFHPIRERQREPKHPEGHQTYETDSDFYRLNESHSQNCTKIKFN